MIGFDFHIAAKLIHLVSDIVFVALDVLQSNWVKS